jgi:hypothetical protein
MSDVGILVPLFALSIPITAIWAKHKRQLAEMHIRNGVAQNSPANDQLLRKTAELEERVRVLERIVTDGNYNLASQIEALRSEEHALPPRSPAAPSSIGVR